MEPSASRITGVLCFVAILHASQAKRNALSGDEAAKMHRRASPCPPKAACSRSACTDFVGIPVAGPALWTLRMRKPAFFRCRDRAVCDGRRSVYVSVRSRRKIRGCDREMRVENPGIFGVPHPFFKDFEVRLCEIGFFPEPFGDFLPYVIHGPFLIWYELTPAIVPAGARISAGKLGRVTVSSPATADAVVNSTPCKLNAVP